MTRDEWIFHFIDELEKLRPHLKTAHGPSKLMHAQAAQAHATGEPDPRKAALALHQRLTDPASRR